MRNAVSECEVNIAENEVCPAASVKLVVPDTSEIVARRNEVLTKMRTRSVLSAGKYTQAEFDAAQQEPQLFLVHFAVRIVGSDQLGSAFDSGPPPPSAGDDRDRHC